MEENKRGPRKVAGILGMYERGRLAMRKTANVRLSAHLLWPPFFSSASRFLSCFLSRHLILDGLPKHRRQGQGLR